MQIIYNKQPQKFLKKLSKRQIKRICDKIDKLEINPVPHDAKSIENLKRSFRIRVGSIRILYRLDYKINKIVIFKINNREKAYE